MRVDGAVAVVARADGGTARARRLTAGAAALWQKFPPRVRAASWPATLAGRHDVVGQAMAGPYAAGENDQARYARRLGVVKVLDWLEAQSGLTWQDRWLAGAGSAAGQDWRDTAERQLKDAGQISASNRTVRSNLSLALELLICCDVIRPDLAWLLASATPAHLAAGMARVRDPDGFAALQKIADPADASVTTTRRAMLQVAVVMGVKGGLVSDNHGRRLPGAARSPGRPAGRQGQRRGLLLPVAARGGFPAAGRPAEGENARPASPRPADRRGPDRPL